MTMTLLLWTDRLLAGNVRALFRGVYQGSTTTPYKLHFGRAKGVTINRKVCQIVTRPKFNRRLVRCRRVPLVGHASISQRNQERSHGQHIRDVRWYVNGQTSVAFHHAIRDETMFRVSLFTALLLRPTRDHRQLLYNFGRQAKTHFRTSRRYISYFQRFAY